MTGRGAVRVGVAGWVFEPWRGTFYPEDLRQKDELAFASKALTAIEINATFYRNQSPKSFANWAAETPENFIFSVKGPKYITHQLKLMDAGQALATFLASGPLRLGHKLGPIVWQLPPNLGFERERLGAFLSLLPKTPQAAQTLALGHEARGAEVFTSADGVPLLRHAVEVRHASFRTPEWIALLRKHGVAQVIADTADWPYLDATADFVYARLQGPPAGGSYGASELTVWAERVAAWAEGRPDARSQLLAPAAEPRPCDVFAFFVHEDKLNAPRNASALMSLVGVAPSGVWSRG